MEFLSWYDWIQPTNPYASIFFGIIFTVIMALFLGFDTKKFQTVAIALVTGLSVTVIGVAILNFIGFYG